MRPRHIPKSLAAKLSRHGFRVLKTQASRAFPPPDTRHVVMLRWERDQVRVYKWSGRYSIGKVVVLPASPTFKQCMQAVAEVEANQQTLGSVMLDGLQEALLASVHNS